jgi:hypothetical protein
VNHSKVDGLEVVSLLGAHQSQAKRPGGDPERLRGLRGLERESTFVERHAAAYSCETSLNSRPQLRVELPRRAPGGKATWRGLFCPEDALSWRTRSGGRPARRAFSVASPRDDGPSSRRAAGS